ncbi:MAG: hypothetical protein ACRELF_11220, partial [Gemmataceae bacterium]
IAMLFVAASARADSLSHITALGAQGANDSANWSQLGPDATELGTTFTAFSSLGYEVNGSFSGASPTSLVAAVCPATPCSWANGGDGSTPFAAGDSLIWTADGGNSGNGPITLTIGTNVSGVGAMIQEDAPGTFTAEIQVFNGASSLGSFSESSDSNGDPIYIGVKDTSGANINKAEFSITSTGGAPSDFAIGALQLNNPSSPIATPTASPTPTGGVTPTTTPTATPTSTAVPVALLVTPAGGNFGNVKIGKSKVKKFHLKNPAKKGGPSITIRDWSVMNGPAFVIFDAKTTCTMGMVLAPKKKCLVAVVFAPTAAGLQSTTLTINDDANNAPQTVQLSGTGK